jgi:SAM-dependent methyltransferase
MAASVPIVFERPLQRRRLRRAAAMGFADFLVARAAQDLTERLSTVLRRFPLALDLATPTPHAAAALISGGFAGEVVRASADASLIGPFPGCVADEEALPFAPGSFDLAVSLLALHAVNDLPGALAQLRQTLKADGLFIGCLLGGSTLSELRQTFTMAEGEVEGGASPRVAPFGDVRDMGALLQRAGFALPVTDTEPVTVRYGDAFGLMRDLRAMGLTNTLAARRKRPLRRETLMRAARVYGERFAGADGRVTATFELIWLSGWAPDPSQPKPLQPGSAKVRLADALGTRERKA